MSEMKVDVMTALSRIAYDNDAGCLEHLESLSLERLTNTAFGLAVMGSACLDALAATTGIDAELVRDSWLASLTDVANAQSP